MTTNGQWNGTRGYHIKPTNSTCNMISCFHLKGPCSFVRGQKIFLSAQSNSNYCQKALSMKNIWITIKKQNNLRKNPCCVGSLLQYTCIRSQYKVNLSNDKAELYEKTVNSKLK